MDPQFGLPRATFTARTFRRFEIVMPEITPLNVTTYETTRVHTIMYHEYQIK